MTEEELVEALKGMDVVIAGTDPFTGRVIREGAATGLRMVARFGIGLDNVDLKAATECKVVVTYAPKASSDSVAEFTVALLLSLLRHIPEADSATKRGEWPMGALRGVQVSGKMVGVIGFGTIGKKVAEILTAMGSRVIAYDPYVNDDPRLTSLERVLKESDIVTVHSALNSGTRHLLGKREFDLMKKDAVFVNTARGTIVDEKALYSALESKAIAGAALDVLESEPPSGAHPLAKLPNVLLTPHIAGNTVQATARIGLDLLEDVRRVLGGRAPKFPANPEVIPLLDLTPPDNP